MVLTEGERARLLAFIKAADTRQKASFSVRLSSRYDEPSGKEGSR